MRNAFLASEASKSTPSSFDLSDLEKRMDNLELNAAAGTNNASSIIRFHNLNFTLKDQADAWLETHAPHGNFGFIIDFHTLLEHIHHAINGVDSLRQLQNVYKLKLSTISESLAVTSFEVATPRFLNTSGGQESIVYIYEKYL